MPTANALRERADAIHKAGRGTLFTYADAKSAAVKDVKADDFWKALNAALAGWTRRRSTRQIPKLALGRPPRTRWRTVFRWLVVMAEAPAGPGSPLLSKLYQESNLRLGRGPRGASSRGGARMRR